jgi:hypothetical protein
MKHQRGCADGCKGSAAAALLRYSWTCDCRRVEDPKASLDATGARHGSKSTGASMTKMTWAIPCASAASVAAQRLMKAKGTAVLDCARCSLEWTSSTEGTEQATVDCTLAPPDGLQRQLDMDVAGRNGPGRLRNDRTMPVEMRRGEVVDAAKLLASREPESAWGMHDEQP